MKKIFLILLFFIAFSCIDEKPAEYEEKLVNQFKDNFQKFNVSEAIVQAGPR